MASTKWLHQRFWCGRLPLFHLLADNELQSEIDASLFYFSSSELASLRTQIRLKLKELPLIHQTRRSAATYADALELLRQYLPYLLALRQFEDPRNCSTKLQSSSDTKQPQGLAHGRLRAFPPLFYGVQSMDLSSDRIVGREQRVEHTVNLDLTLTLLAMAQLHALYAEAQVEQAMRLQNGAMLQIGERSWQDASTLFAQSAAFADSARTRFSPGDTQFGSMLQLFSVVATTARVLGGLCALHGITTRVFFLIILDESTECLARAVSVYARHAVDVARRGAMLLETVPETEFRCQLAWLVATYETRWRAVLYSCEQTVFQLDFHPEIAVHFHEAILRLRLAPLPPYSHRHNTFFTRIAQELQLVHQEHLNRAMDEKRSLIDACQQKLVRELDSLERDSVCDVSDNSVDRTRHTVQEVYDEHESAIHERLEIVTASVKRVSEAANVGGESICTSDASQLGSWDGEDQARQRQQTMAATVPTDTNGVVNGIVALTSPPRRASSGSITAAGRVTDTRDSSQDTFTAAASTNAAKALVATSASPSTLLDAIALKQRPSSAQLPTRESSASSPQRDTGWVKMVVGGKTLHFESASSAAANGVPLTGHSHALLNKRRNAVPMADIDEPPSNASSLGQRSGLKVRPSSSPSYLTSKAAKVSRSDESAPQHKTQMWVPTRGQCALCERRYMRSHLAGVVLMKRIFDLRRKWGMVIQDSKKFYAASALYAKAQVCLLCQEILLHEDERSLQAFDAERKLDAPGPQRTTTLAPSAPPAGDDIGLMIFTSIMRTWHQQPREDNVHRLEDVALNKRARQSSTVFDMDARNAVQADAVRCAHTREEMQPWWEVDLANYHVIHSVKIWLRDEVSHLYNVTSSSSGNGSATAQTAAGQQQQQLPLQRKTALRPVSRPTPLQHLGMFPLYISISMKTGVGRDLDDILAGCVSSHCVDEKTLAPIVWHAPPNSRGRFVRIQAERLAVLHVEKVHVYIASATHQQQLLHACRMRKQTLRQQLKRAAFRASVIANPAAKSVDDGLSQLGQMQSMQDARTTGTMSAYDSSSSNQQAGSARESSAVQVYPHALVSTFLNPEQAEKKRISRLYSRFKGLLDARSKYMLEETGVVDAQRRHQQQYQQQQNSEDE